jgi:hypothetical protein
MHPRERVLERAKLLREQNKEIPTDLAAQAEQLGLFVSALYEPSTSALTTKKPKERKEYPNGKNTIHNT